VRAHATWDEARHPRTVEWLHHATRLPDFGAIVAARLARDPREVIALRAEQDQPDPAAKTAACVRHTSLAAAAPADDDLRYLAIRCMPPGHARDEAFLTASAAAPDNPWIAMAAGYVHAERSDWEKALACWAVARKAEYTGESVVLVSARVLRLLGPAGEDELHRLTLGSPYVRELLALEQGNDLPSRGPVAAYGKLARGALGEVMEVFDGEPETRARLVRLVAASRGATPEQVAAASALRAEEGLDGHTLWPAIGLAVRNKEIATSLIARMMAHAEEDEVPSLEQFLEPDRLVRDRAALRAALSTLGPVTRGHAYVLGVVILGDAAPEEWRAEARALLFAPERPFL